MTRKTTAHHHDRRSPIRVRRAALAAGAAALIALAAAALPRDRALAAPAAAPVPYPEGYREWTHVKTLVLQEGHPLFEAFGGMHHVYVNDRGLKTLRSGRTPFPDGTVFVFDLLEAAAGDHAVAEGPRKIVGVMHKDAKRYAATGGWGYEGFKGNGRDRAVSDGGDSCHSCHASQKDRDYVFSAWRD
jgi:hypothetical protein